MKLKRIKERRAGKKKMDTSRKTLASRGRYM
jgi:hypothetical protein